MIEGGKHMLLKNNTGKIIGIGMESILPGETKECPPGYERNPVVYQYLNNGTFEEILPEESGNENSEGKEPVEKKLEDLSEEDLIKYAVNHGIDLGKATTREGILKKILES